MASNRTRTVLAAAVLTGLALAGCERGSGGATTTVIQQSPAGGASATASAAKATVTPISDPKELCHQIRSKARELENAINDFWLLVQGTAWSASDPKIEAAVKRVSDAYDQAFPVLDQLIGPDVPRDVADAVKSFVQKTKDLSAAISENASSDELNPLAHRYGDAKDSLDEMCKIGS